MIVSFQDNEQLKIWVVSDDLESKTAQLEMRLFDFSGSMLWEKEIKFEMKANSSGMIQKVELNELGNMGSLDQRVMVTTLLTEQNKLYTDYHYFTRPKYLKLENPDISYTISEQENDFVVILHSKKLARNVFLSSDASADHFSENYFDLLAGEYKTVSFPAICDIEKFKKSLSVTYLQKQ
jgi:beta-mannosidase